MVNVNEEFEDKMKEETYLREELQKKIVDLTELANDYQTLVKINKEFEMKIEAGLGAEERKELEDIVSNLQFENKALTSDMKGNEEVVAKLENDVMNLVQAMEETRNENAKLKENKANFENFKVEHDRFLEEYEKMERELNKLKFANKELDEELNDLYAKEDGTREEARKVNDDMQKLENEIVTKDEKLKNVEHELINVTKKLTMIQMDLEKERNQVSISVVSNNILHISLCIPYMQTLSSFILFAREKIWHIGFNFKTILYI